MHPKTNEDLNFRSAHRPNTAMLLETAWAITQDSDGLAAREPRAEYASLLSLHNRNHGNTIPHTKKKDAANGLEMGGLQKYGWGHGFHRILTLNSSLSQGIMTLNKALIL